LYEHARITMRLKSLGLPSLILAFRGVVRAQSGVVFGEIGSIVDKFGNGSRYKGVLYGGGGQFIVNGHSEKSYSILSPMVWGVSGRIEQQHIGLPRLSGLRHPDQVGVIRSRVQLRLH